MFIACTERTAEITFEANEQTAIDYLKKETREVTG